MRSTNWNRLKRHFNLHRFLWLLALVVFVIAWNRGLALLYGLFALILGVLLLSYIYPWLMLRDVRVTRKQASVGKAGGQLTLEYHIQARRKLFYIELCEHLPFNITTPRVCSFLPVVAADHRFTVSVHCEVRGAFTLDAVSLESSYPFGVVSRARTLPTEPATVLVLPRTFSINHLAYAAYSRHGVDGIIQSANAGSYHEFSGLREYRYGDSLKRVHWGATARHQELVIKEYDSYDRPTILVVLDQRAAFDIGELPETTFEYAVQIAASVIEYAIKNNIGVYVYGRGREATSFSVMPGAQGSHEFLERLARVRSDGSVPYPQVLGESLAEFGDVNTVMTFTHRSAKDTDRIVGMIDGHITHLDIDMVDQSFITPLAGYQQRQGVRHGNRITWSVSRLTRLEELFRV